MCMGLQIFFMCSHIWPRTSILLSTQVTQRKSTSPELISAIILNDEFDVLWLIGKGVFDAQAMQVSQEVNDLGSEV